MMTSFFSISHIDNKNPGYLDNNPDEMHAGRIGKYAIS